MARSPLMRLLLRAARLAHAQARTGRGAAELADEARARRAAARAARTTRRAFLAEAGRAGALLGLAGAGVLAPGCPRRPAGAEERAPGGGGGASGGGGAGGAVGGGPAVAVVGAGLGGLAAAWTLAKGGVRARVFDAASRAGGRTHTAPDLFAPGGHVDMGGEFVNTDHLDMLALMEELGIEPVDLDEVYPADADEVLHFGGAARSADEVIDALAPFVPRIAEDRAASGGFAADTEAAAALDRLPLAAYLDRLGLSGWARALVEVACVTEYGLDPGEQSAQYLIQWVGLDLEESSFHLSSDERYIVRGGAGGIAKALHERMRDQVTLLARLVAIRPRPAGAGVRLVFARDGGVTEEVDVDLAILALPFSLLREVEIGVDLSPRKRMAIRDLGYGTNAKLLLGVERPAWRDAGLNGDSLNDAGFQSGWECGLGRGLEPRGLTLYTGGRVGVDLGAGTPEAQAERHLPGVERVLPGAKAAYAGKVVRWHWPSYPFTRGSYSCYRPGQWAAIRGVEVEPAGALYFAGEHTARRGQGFMNGAAETGRKAAEAVLARIGVGGGGRSK